MYVCMYVYVYYMIRGTIRNDSDFLTLKFGVFYDAHWPTPDMVLKNIDCWEGGPKMA